MTAWQEAGDLSLGLMVAGMQIQAELGEGHVNIIEAKEIILTDRHLCLVMEYAAGNSLTGEGPL